MENSVGSKIVIYKAAIVSGHVIFTTQRAIITSIDGNDTTAQLENSPVYGTPQNIKIGRNTALDKKRALQLLQRTLEIREMEVRGSLLTVQHSMLKVRKMLQCCE